MVEWTHCGDYLAFIALVEMWVMGKNCHHLYRVRAHLEVSFLAHLQVNLD